MCNSPKWIRCTQARTHFYTLRQAPARTHTCTKQRERGGGGGVYTLVNVCLNAGGNWNVCAVVSSKTMCTQRLFRDWLVAVWQRSRWTSQRLYQSRLLKKPRPRSPRKRKRRRLVSLQLLFQYTCQHDCFVIPEIGCKRTHYGLHFFLDMSDITSYSVILQSSNSYTPITQ